METNASILIIDDIPQNIQVLGSFLSTHNYNISFATSANEALILLKDNHYDLLLLDIMMPEMNGYELCAILKSQPEYSDIPIIYITAKSDVDSIVKGFQSGGVDYITKPFNSFELLARVETHLKLRQQSIQLQNMNQLLEEQVKKRTIELQTANDRLSLLEKTKSNFLQLISHELRTPISGINILADLLLIKLGNNDYKHYVESIKLSSEKIIEFSELALLITTLSFDKDQLNRESLSLDKLINHNIERYYSNIQQKNIDIQINGNTDIYFSGDAKLIDKSFSIIFDNSIKFGKTCGVLSINVFATEHDFTVQFIDDGNGFSEEQLINLFEPFNITDINHHKQGFGLSLSVLKIIMEAHEGKISISNNLSGKGANVSFTLKRDY
jgi:two-component system sensor histidine kinase/response regulator